MVALVELADFNLSTTSSISQTFSYTHFWASDNTTSAIIEPKLELRSGNPGYQHDKPVLGGVLVEQAAIADGSPDESSNEGNTADSMWGMGEVGALTTMGLSSDGECFERGSVVATRRLPILFGSSARVGCMFSISRSTLANDCTRLKNLTMSLLTGSGGVARIRQTRVGVLGKPEYGRM